MLNNNINDANKLEICELSYYDEDKGVEVPSIRTYVIVENDNDSYFNHFNKDEEYPMLKRVYNGEMDNMGTYGTALISINLICGSSTCFIRNSGITMKDIFGKNEVTDDELKLFILKDKRYFKDRASIASEKLGEGFHVLNMLKIISNDSKTKKMLNSRNKDSKTLTKTRKW